MNLPNPVPHRNPHIRTIGTTWQWAQAQNIKSNSSRKTKLNHDYSVFTSTTRCLTPQYLIAFLPMNTVFGFSGNCLNAENVDPFHISFIWVQWESNPRSQWKALLFWRGVRASQSYSNVCLTFRNSKIFIKMNGKLHLLQTFNYKISLKNMLTIK
jgi:hypothetical protein